ncbi:MAG: transmembrane 220 family protein [Gammaproteobacteria bacterium]|nr:transmembrane 220 family protein [Gammaproteobacteria bacterium]MDH5305021.1 transmembrane 220 family protein [Gammaproteobacteria bacterium]MDH5322912.1 transmembrane 220 family protein [Gammaproteobacteria bacterium]
MRILHFVFALIFLTFAGIQFNDPDPLYWVTVYAATGLIAVARGFGRSSSICTAIATGLVVAGLLIAFPSLIDYLQSGDFVSITGDMRSASYVEPAREFVGLLLAFGLLLYYLRR